jgi:hypothetical protein
MDNSRTAVLDFYEKCLTVNAHTNVAETMGKILADNFVSYGSVDSKTKEQLIGQIGFFWSLVPDLVWSPEEIIQDGNKFVVRSIASGTPNGNFMGLPTDGTKSFKIMTIDIHTVENGQVQSVYHLEDWGTAMQQLK